MIPRGRRAVRRPVADLLATRMRSLLRCLSDRRDDRRARALREALGASGVLVSWHRVDPPHPKAKPGPWLARASGPDWPGTIQRLGHTRLRAIGKATGALRQLARGD